ncbi:Beta-ketoacyl synthase [Segniliparus rotundus DSM 44985]|uniref:Beta-ketoacyl synthase n=1 Tax=Segniliparus rotundus (strain ATCC BAA-972 / CDC 1076 / CIP 108378 / DSM 44985 / JCM 13578) TaxID=640132 RepID=D6ZEG1_SEGRD|nr:type I polyketide synthase [Segniliparus rotundus]ADG99437.1 Beta-ketoacyl synthase [Segniliparus rotundus DSM 44985]
MEIDVAGMACRFPGAPDLGGFWDLLLQSRHSTREIPENRWRSDEYFSPGPVRPGRSNTRHASFIDDPEQFDFGFFGIAPNEAAASDIQQRLVLQTAYHALEDAGIDPRELRGSDTGVFVGVMASDWGALHLADYAGMTPQRGVGNGLSMIANRVSYSLDLAGPSLSVDTACSSSLTAVHLAANALRGGECGIAIAAGVNLMLTPSLSIFYAQAGLSAPDGRCRPFAQSANGIGRSEGVGAVVLRRAEDRPDNAPSPYAAIHGSFVGQDGRSNGITAPSRRGQERVIRCALRSAQRSGSEIDFVEAHGTGTVLGDMIEAQALGTTCGDRAHRPALVMGSVKGNIGHAEGAAGIAGFIKACLSVHHRTVPASLFAQDENPALTLGQRGIRLAKSAEKLPQGQVFAGVSSFGMGGTNAHVVIGSTPRRRRPTRPGGVGVLTVSANNTAALRRNLRDVTEKFGETDHWARYCYSTNQVKSGGQRRIALVARDGADLEKEALVAEHRLTQQAELPSRGRRPRIAFLYTGQGAQYRSMALAARDDHPGFAAALEAADALVRPSFGGSVMQAIERGEDHRGRPLDDTAVAQPALFAVQYALTQALAEHGVRPHVVLGHSVGEIAGCVAAGVLTAADAGALAVERGALMGALPAGGAMLAARLSAHDARHIISGEVALAAVNGATSVVFSGPAEQIRRIAAQLAERGTRTRALRVSHAFHSPAMTAAADPLAAAAPTPATEGNGVAMISSVTGEALKPGSVDGEYWRNQLLATVEFDAALRSLAETKPTHVVEIGPQAVLLGLLHASGLLSDSVRTAPIPRDGASGLEFADALAQLWQSGADVRWSPLYQERDRVITRLPSYVFADEERFFASAATVGPTRAAAATRSDKESVPDLSQADAQLEAVLAADAPEPGGTSDRSRGMSADTVHSAVIRVLATVGGHREEVLRPTADLREDLGFDSVQAMQFADRIASEVDMPQQLDPTAFGEDLVTVADLTRLVVARAGLDRLSNNAAQR